MEICCNVSHIPGREMPAPSVLASFEQETRQGIKIRTETFLCLIDTGSDVSWIPKSKAYRDAKKQDRRRCGVFNSDDKYKLIKTYEGAVYLIGVTGEIKVDLIEDMFETSDKYGIIGMDILGNLTVTMRPSGFITLEN